MGKAPVVDKWFGLILNICGYVPLRAPSLSRLYFNFFIDFFDLVFLTNKKAPLCLTLIEAIY